MGALADRPEYLTCAAYVDELCELVVGYLQPAKEAVKGGRTRPPARTSRLDTVAAHKARSSRKR